jgi:hypothetical protein
MIHAGLPEGHELLNGDGQSPADESLTLAAELARVEASILSITAEMDAHGESPTLYKRLRLKEGDHKRLKAKLAEARQKAADPKSESWGQAQSLIAAFQLAADKEDAQVRLRSALRRIVESIQLVIAVRGRDRLAAVQVWFDQSKHRDYLMVYRSARGNKHQLEPARYYASSRVEYLDHQNRAQDEGFATRGWPDLRDDSFAELTRDSLVAYPQQIIESMLAEGQTI